MRDLAILIFITLDGVMQAVRMLDEDTSGGFAHGGWATPYWDDVMAQVGHEAMAKPYDMLLGRKTYEMFAANQSANMNDGGVYVASSILTDTEWGNATVLSGDVVEEIARLKAQDGPLLQIHGSWELIQALHSAGLIDEYRLWLFPVTLGSGKRLFDTGTSLETLELVKSKPTGNGVVMNIYRKGSSVTNGL